MRVQLVAAFLAVGSASVPGHARAAAPADAGADDEIYSEASKLYDEGRGKFETADYAAAIELWTRAYTKLPATPDYAKIKVLLLYDLSTAQERAFEVDNRAAHLRQARILLENFEASIPSIYGHGDEASAERERVLERLARLDAKLSEVGDETADADPDEADPTSRIPVVVGEGAAEPPRPDDGRRRKLLIAGGALLGVGVAGLGLMAGGFVLGNNANDISGLDPDDVDGRRRRFDRGRLGNALAAAGGVIGGASIITGVALMGASRDRLGGRSAQVVPSVGRGFAGLSVSGQF